MNNGPAAETWPAGPGLPVLLGPTGAAPRPAPAFVEGLGRWLGWKEAIALSTVLAQPAAPAAPAAQPLGLALRAQVATERAALEAEFSRVHAALQHRLAQALDEAERAHDGSFLPWRRCCHQTQQAFEAAASALRAQARAALRRLGQATAGSNVPALPHLGELAALDAALAQVLAVREQTQLALLAVLVEPHFLRHLSHLRQNDDPPGFRHTLQPLLQADLELRLQPVWGLLEALREAHTRA